MVRLLKYGSALVPVVTPFGAFVVYAPFIVVRSRADRTRTTKILRIASPLEFANHIIHVDRRIEREIFDGRPVWRGEERFRPWNPNFVVTEIFDGYMAAERWLLGDQ